MRVFSFVYVNMFIKLSLKSLESCRSTSCQKFGVLDLLLGGDLCWILFCDFGAGGKCC